MFGFTRGLRFDREALPGGRGFNLFPERSGVQQVHERRYHRGAGRRETQIELSSADFLGSALPGWAERLHITLSHGRLEARPVPNHTFSIRKSFRDAADPMTAFMALSAGDSHCLESLGFRIAGHLEWRPPEARDIASGRDLTESGVLTALANSSPAAVFNEDIRTVDWLRLRAQLNEQQPIACLHLSLACDCYSALKGKKARAASLEDLTTTRDLFYDALRAVETLRPVTVLVEQVPGFGASAECEMLTTRLRRWGYHVSAKVFDPVLFGAMSSRSRFYLVASIFPGFAWPEPTGKNTTPVLDLIANDLPSCRDVSHCKAVHDGIAVGRARHLKPGALVAPTIFKSQNRQPKDACYIALEDGRFLLPSRTVLQKLCDIPPSFTTAHCGEELATEAIGQSISFSMHHAIAKALKDHLSICHSGAAGLVVSQAAPPAQLGQGEFPEISGTC